ncbi:Ubiquitin-conjugating enzyme E2 PEX4 [Taenia solium]|eukprot:TsM_000167900 transcript=TsM_000167900 gene=TsM_000167900
MLHQPRKSHYIHMICPVNCRTFMRDLQQLYATIDTSTNGQASIIGTDEMTVKILLRPKSGCNAHAEFLLTIKCCTAYPEACPDISFDSPIFHPNIDPSDGAICFSLLSECRSCYSLMDVVKAVLYVIDHPAFDSPNNRFGVLKDLSRLPVETARVLAGLPVKGRRFPPNRAWFEWASANRCLPIGEEELEEVEEALWEKNRFSQKHSEDFDISAKTEVHEGAHQLDSSCPSDTTSDTIPSFAKIRRLFDPGENGLFQNPYESRWTPFEVDSQRILIWHPSNDQRRDTCTVFYFIEFLGTEYHRNELGENYNTLFIGSVVHECQTYPESRQTSSNCPWYAYIQRSGSPYPTDTSYDSSLNLSDMFEINEPPMQTLTSDFCSWSALDGKGINGLFDGLFFEGPRHRGDFTCFLGEDSDGGSERQGIRWLFDSSSPDHDKVEKVDLSMLGIQIPPWRASSGRMMSDLCRFCARDQSIRNLVLPDPTALSPLSPLLNLMEHHSLPGPQLNGVLWLTPLDALSPFYHVPIPHKEGQEEKENDDHERGDSTYPTPICLRFLAVTALITNWVAWLSRMEVYAALGMSRFYLTAISAPVAACLLQPFSLGCGQAPLMDLWPIWLIRRLLTLSLRLSQLRFPFHHRSHHRLQYLFPFSDLDEI